MAEYDNRGRGTFGENDRKTEDWHPDMRGSGQLPDGTPVWIDCWNNTSKDGHPFVSWRLRLKDEAPKQVTPRRAKTQTLAQELDDDVPF